MNEFGSLKLDKTILTVAPLTDLPDDKEYWLAQSPYARLQAVEILRQLNYGARQSTARLQRVLEVAHEHQVEYLIIGGYAVAYHGYPRAIMTGAGISWPSPGIWPQTRVSFHSTKTAWPFRGRGLHPPSAENAPVPCRAAH